MIKNISLILVLCFLFLLVTLVGVNALSYGPPYLDEECYHNQCERSELIFYKQAEKCIYYPIFNQTQISSDGSADLTNDAENKEEFLNLPRDSQILLNKIYNKCIKSPLEERNRKGIYGGLIELYFAGKTLIIFCILLLIQGIVLYYLLRKVIKKKRDSMRILIIIFLILSGLIGIIFLGIVNSLGLLFYLSLLSKKMVLAYCSKTFETYIGYCQPLIYLFPYYFISSLFQILLFIIFKFRKKQK